MNRNLINKSIWEYTSPEDWLDFVKGLAIRPENAKNSKVIPEFTLIRGKRTIVRLKRDSKEMTQGEVATVASEYDVPYADLLDLLHKRKIKVLLDDGNYYAPAKPARKSRTKKDADNPRRKRKVKASSGDQQQLFGSNPDLFTKELLHSDQESKE